ncbi:MAG: DNA repair protein RecN [Opitutales bacterium]
MLQYLRIRNLALLKETELTFEAGFVAVTGETGAGKSVLLGALSLLSGARADKTLIRQGADACFIEAGLFLSESAAVDRILEGCGLPLCEDGVLLLSREFSRDRMPKIQVNGALTTLANLKVLGEAWIDFHGPGEPQKLFHEKHQLALLDLYAGNEVALEAYREAFHAWQAIRRRIEALRNTQRLDPDEIAFHQAQIARIDAIEPSEEGIAELERQFSRVQRAQDLLAEAGAIEEGLAGDDGVVGRLQHLVRAAGEIAAIDPAGGQPLLDRLNSLAIEAEDLAGEAANLRNGLDLEEAEAMEIQQRMEQWLEVRRKFGGSVEAVLAHRNDLAERIDSQGDVEGRLHQLEKEEAQAYEAVKKEATSLNAAREAAATKLASRAIKLLKRLGFKKANLSIEIVGRDTFTEQGNTGCRMLFAPNAGQDLLPLNKVASSGETARVMLALKTLLAEVDRTPLLVFDEVDANVGGEIGREVGAAMRELADGHQVFCITHLPQVACQAHQHFSVEKQQTSRATAVTINSIHDDEKARIDELARMLGDRKSDMARRHARDLLAAD